MKAVSSNDSIKSLIHQYIKVERIFLHVYMYFVVGVKVTLRGSNSQLWMTRAGTMAVSFQWHVLQ